MTARCTSRFATKTEYGDPYWPTCDLAAGHDGGHMHGHYADVSWHWSDGDAMTPADLAAWGAR